MIDKTYSASAAKKHWREILDMILQGQTVIITRWGIPCAKITGIT